MPHLYDPVCTASPPSACGFIALRAIFGETFGPLTARTHRAACIDSSATPSRQPPVKMLLFRAFLVSLATASIDLPRDWQAQHCRGTHLSDAASCGLLHRSSRKRVDGVESQATETPLTRHTQNVERHAISPASLRAEGRSC